MSVDHNGLQILAENVSQNQKKFYYNTKFEKFSIFGFWITFSASTWRLFWSADIDLQYLESELKIQICI